MKYKMIIADYDGTTAVGNVIPTEVVNAIKLFREKGGKFVFCTGRAESSIINVMKDNGVTVDAVISYQGSKVLVGDLVALNGGIDKQTAISLIKDLRTFNKGVVAFCNDEIFYEGSDGVERYVDFYRPYVKDKKYDDLLEFVNGYDGYFQKLVITKTPEEDLSYVEDFVTKKYGGEVLANSGGVRLMELVSSKYSKYEASSFVAKAFNLDESEVVTVGDSTNDLTLLKYGFGIAVGNAEPRLKEVAKFIAPSVNDFPLKFIVDKALSGKDF